MALNSGIAEALFDIVGHEYVWLNSAQSRHPVPEVCERTDADAVVFPRTTQQVAELVRGAAACDVPIRAIPSLTGASTNDADRRRGLGESECGGIVLALNRMNRVLEVDIPRGRARVQPAVSIFRLGAIIAAAGIAYARRSVSPAGDAATIAGEGTSGNRWRMLGFEAVLASGEVVRADWRSGTGPHSQDWDAAVLTEIALGVGRPNHRDQVSQCYSQSHRGVRYGAESNRKSRG